MERNIFLYGLLILILMFLNLVAASSSARLPRSPQFGGGGFSQASAQSGAFGGGPVYYPGGGYGGGYGGGGFGGGGYGGGGYGGGGFGGGYGRGYGNRRFGRGGAPLSISVAKSVSIGGGK